MNRRHAAAALGSLVLLSVALVPAACAGRDRNHPRQCQRRLGRVGSGRDGHRDQRGHAVHARTTTDSAGQYSLLLLPWAATRST